MTIKVTYNVTDVYMTQSVSPVYINVSYTTGGSGGAAVWGSITGTLSDQTDLQNALNAKVPYSGATSDVSLGEYGINLGNVVYDTTPTGIPTEQGSTYWDADAETVALIMNGTIQKIGEDTFYHVRNTTGSTIPKGSAVRFSGTTGNSGRLLIAPMLANGTYPSQYYMGITAEEIANNADGKVYHFGKMRNINTSAFADGDVLYVSPSVAGGLTATAPVAPNNIIVAAAVVHAANNGTLMIRTTLGSNINSDEGVLLTTPTANEGLFYDSGLWVNKSITTALGYTPANAATTLTINGVTYDLSTSRTWTVSGGISGSGTSGQVTYWSGASAVSGSSTFLWNAASNLLRVNGGIGVNRDAFGGRAIDITGGGIRLTGSVSGTYEVNGNNASFNIVTTGGTAGINIGDTNNARISIIGNSYNYEIQSNASLFKIRDITAGNIDRFAIHSTGNVGIGFGSTDPAVRLGVSGDTLLRGSGATSATTALTVQNSSSTNLFRVRNDGYTLVNTGHAIGTSLANYIISSGVDNITSAAGLNLNLLFGSASTSGFGLQISGFNTSTRTATSGVSGVLNLSHGFAPTSGTGTFIGIQWIGTINQTGGANGITRGLYVNPTLTAAADFRAIETARGNIVFSNLPTSAAGLPSGALWNNGGVINIV